MIIEQVVKLVEFRGQWEGAYSQQHCYLCMRRLYHTAEEHALFLSQDLREEIAR